MRPLRNKNPEAYRLITIRTEEARLWIRPTEEVKQLIGGIVARYQETLGVLIYAYCFLGNHYHMLIKAPLENSDEFCENINRETARRLNYLHHREGKFWGRRYDDQEILTEDDLLAAFLYIITNPTRHGLVPNSSEWSGLSSYHQSLTGKDETYSFFHYSRTKEEGQVTTHTLRLSPLPQHVKMSQSERADLLRGLLVERTAELVSERKSKGLGFLGLARIKAQTAGKSPRNVARSPRPLCYTITLERRLEYRKQYLYRRKLYDDASMRYRLGEKNVGFPEHTFKPPLHRKPRLLPFKALTLLDFKHVA